MGWYGVPLPYVTIASHLGHELHESGTMEHNANMKKSIFISRSMEIREQISFAVCLQPPASNLWDLCGVRAGQVCNIWSIGARDCWEVMRATHRYIVDNLGSLTY